MDSTHYDSEFPFMECIAPQYSCNKARECQPTSLCGVLARLEEAIVRFVELEIWPLDK